MHVFLLTDFSLYAVLVFEDLVEVRVDSEKRIKKFLEIPAKLRIFSAIFAPKLAESSTSTNREAMSTGKISQQSFNFVGLGSFCSCLYLHFRYVKA